MNLVETVVKAGTYVGEGIGTLVTAVELSYSIVAAIEKNPDLAYNSLAAALFFGVFTAYCSEYRRAIDAKNALITTLQEMELDYRTYRGFPEGKST